MYFIMIGVILVFDIVLDVIDWFNDFIGFVVMVYGGEVIN